MLQKFLFESSKPVDLSLIQLATVEEKTGLSTTQYGLLWKYAHLKGRLQKERKRGTCEIDQDKTDEI